MYKAASSSEDYEYNGAGWAYENACKASFLVPPKAGSSLYMSANAIASFYNDETGDPFDRIRVITNNEIRALSEIEKKKVGSVNGFDITALDTSVEGPLGELWTEYPEW